MDEFLRIRKLTQEAIQSNQKHLDIVPRWKSEIRSKLLFARKAFNERIERYVDKFSDQMKGIETAQTLTDDEGNACSFDAESKKLQKTVDEMIKYHGEILAIFEKISTAPAERRIKYIDMTKGYMKAIEKKTREHGASMEASASRLKEALHTTVPTDKLD